MKFRFEDLNAGLWFNPILVVKDDDGKERLFGLTEIDIDGVSLPQRIGYRDNKRVPWGTGIVQWIDGKTRRL